MDKIWLFANYIGAWLQISSNVCSFYNIVVIYDYLCFNDVEPVAVHWYKYSFSIYLCFMRYIYMLFHLLEHARNPVEKHGQSEIF